MELTYACMFAYLLPGSGASDGPFRSDERDPYHSRQEFVYATSQNQHTLSVPSHYLIKQ